jgi:hypothetical protein
MAREVASASAVVGECVILWRAFAFGQGLLDDDVDSAAVFRVHADQAGMLGGLGHGAEDRGIVKHEYAGISHEKLETGDALADELAHFLELGGAEVGDDAVESVVRHCFVMGFFHPAVESLAQGLSFVLDGEIDERGGPPESSGDGAGFEVVCARSPAEGHVEVGVDVDSAGHYEVAGGIDHPAGVFDRELRSDGGNFFAVDTNVGGACIRCRDDRTVSDYRVKTHIEFLRSWSRLFQGKGETGNLSVTPAATAKNGGVGDVVRNQGAAC